MGHRNDCNRTFWASYFHRAHLVRKTGKVRRSLREYYLPIDPLENELMLSIGTSPTS